jgi:cell division septum initiation protein DivIVA
MDSPDRTKKLPTAFHGYAREPVDKLLEEVEESYRALIAERDELRASLAVADERQSMLTSELDHHVAQERAVADALIEAERLKMEAEHDAEGIRRAADLKADAIMGEAQTRADRLVDERQQELQERSYQAENLLDDAKAKLGSLVRELLEQVGTGSPQQDSAAADQGSAEPRA